MLLPCEDNLLRNLTLDRPSLRVGRYDNLPRDIETALVDILEKEIDLQRRLDILKRDLEVRYDYSTLAAYRSVDKYNDGRIDTFNLGSFLRSTGHYATERELLSIVRRVDTDGDARLSYSEYSEFLRSTNPPVRAVLEENERVQRAASAERYRRSLLASSYSSPLKASSSPRASHSAGRSRAFATPARYTSPVRASFRECSPARCSPVRCSPVRCSPVREPACPVHRHSPTRRPILHLHEEDELVRSLRENVNLEREIESSKTSLALKSDFNLQDAFKIFDQDFRGNVSIADLRDGLSAIGVYPTSEEVELFVTRYDTNGDRRLSFNEFSDAFTALDTYYSHMVNRRASNHRHPLYRRDDCFLSDTQVEFRNVWRVHFKAETAAESIRQRLQRQPCFNVYEAFNSCDLNDDGAVSTDELKRLIQSRGFYVSDKEAAQVVEKFDKSKTGRISYSEVSLKTKNFLVRWRPVVISM